MFTELFEKWQAENQDSFRDMRSGSKMSWAREFAEWLDKNAVQHSMHRTCAYCGADDGKHELDCWVAHNQLPSASR